MRYKYHFFNKDSYSFSFSLNSALNSLKLFYFLLFISSQHSFIFQTTSVSLASERLVLKHSSIPVKCSYFSLSNVPNPAYNGNSDRQSAIF